MLARPIAVLGLWILPGCDDRQFVVLPELLPGTQSVIVARECAGALDVEVMAPEQLASKVRRVNTCGESARVSILEYLSLLSAQGWALGPLQEADPDLCGNRELPEPARAHVISDWKPPKLEVARLPETLARTRFRVPCPCEPRLGVVEHLELPVKGDFAFVRPIDETAVLIVVRAPRGLTHFFRYDLSTLEHLETATVSFVESAATREGSLQAVETDGGGTFWLGSDGGSVHKFTPADGLSLVHSFTRGGSVVALAPSDTGAPMELFALTHDPDGFWRLTDHETDYDFSRTSDGGAAERRSDLAWVGPGRSFGTPRGSPNLVVADGEALREYEWDDGGVAPARFRPIQVLAQSRDLGLVALTRDELVRIDPETEDRWTELRGPSGRRLEPHPGWFHELIDYRGGVLMVDDSGSIFRFHPDFGFCPVEGIRGSSTNLTRAASIGDTIVFGGDMNHEDFDAGRPLKIAVVRPM
ncbi:MAG: hypothetical protein HYV07_10915 [Deltaproteobacteria bacterium]|nr:hypothetical protein [Deltaproteobacteria bacterium]